MKIKKFTEDDIVNAIQYGMGYVCGKHSLTIKKKEIIKVSKQGAEFLNKKKS